MVYLGVFRFDQALHGAPFFRHPATEAWIAIGAPISQTRNGSQGSMVDIEMVVRWSLKGRKCFILLAALTIPTVFPRQLYITAV
jgi:hypothetical protein